MHDGLRHYVGRLVGLLEYLGWMFASCWLLETTGQRCCLLQVVKAGTGQSRCRRMAVELIAGLSLEAEVLIHRFALAKVGP